MGFKLILIDICKKYIFVVSKMFENVQFFKYMTLKFEKGAKMILKTFPRNNKYGLSKNAEFYTDSIFVDMGSEKCT
jgi:hypothetical protein